MVSEGRLIPRCGALALGKGGHGIDETPEAGSTEANRSRAQLTNASNTLTKERNTVQETSGHGDSTLTDSAHNTDTTFYQSEAVRAHNRKDQERLPRGGYHEGGNNRGRAFGPKRLTIPA